MNYADSRTQTNKASIMKPKKTQTEPKRARSKETGVGAKLARNGGLSYLEIPAIDARHSAVFYEKVFGWNLR